MKLLLLFFTSQSLLADSGLIERLWSELHQSLGQKEQQAKIVAHDFQTDEISLSQAAIQRPQKPLKKKESTQTIILHKEVLEDFKPARRRSR